MSKERTVVSQCCLAIGPLPPSFFNIFEDTILCGLRKFCDISTQDGLEGCDQSETYRVQWAGLQGQSPCSGVWTFQKKRQRRSVTIAWDWRASDYPRKVSISPIYPERVTQIPRINPTDIVHRSGRRVVTGISDQIIILECNHSL